MTQQRIDRIDLWRIILRSFFIQGSWSFRFMLAMGFCFSALPICRRLFKTVEEQENFVYRHLEFFNAHPYFASWCLGATAKLEEEALLKRFVDYRSVSKFKERVGSATGAVGDKLFWNLIKPISAGIAIFVALFGSVLAIPLFLIIFNVPHIWLRIYGVFRGYRNGFDIISAISMRKYNKVFIWLFRIGAVVTGMIVSASAAWVLGGGAGLVSFQGGSTGLIAFILTIPFTILLIRLRISISGILIIAICVTAFVGYVFG